MNSMEHVLTGFTQLYFYYLSPYCTIILKYYALVVGDYPGGDVLSSILRAGKCVTAKGGLKSSHRLRRKFRLPAEMPGSAGARAGRVLLLCFTDHRLIWKS